MAGSEDIPSLADLRRGRVRRGGFARAETPTLFDLGALVEAPDETQVAVAPIEQAEAAREERTFTFAVETPLQGSGHAAPSLVVEKPAEEAEEEVAPQIWTVGELVRQVRGLVERSYAQVTVDGEISNWRPASSGHCYFTLKDGQAQLSVVMFRRQASMLRFVPRDGDAVRLYGQLSIYESRGQMQLVAEWMQQQGLGALLAAVRALKEKLRREGLFENKRPLPSFPKCIGVVTSAHGAALRDIVKVCRRRHAAVRLLVYPAAVQGPNCAREVAEGVRWFGAHPDLVDVVIVARGGGSWEDLHGFDDEGVARAIAGCSVPVIAGIGHATDTTIADAAADVSAPTPSAAAELVTAAQHRIEEHVARLSVRVGRAGRYELLRARQRFARIGAEMALRRVRNGVERQGQRLDEMTFRAENAVRVSFRTREEGLKRLEERLKRRHVALRLAEDRRRMDALAARLEASRRSMMVSAQSRLERATVRLEALSPLRVLERGYALVYAPDGTLLTTSRKVSLGERIVARLADGSVSATIFAKK